MRTRRTSEEELGRIKGLLADAALDSALLRLRREALLHKDWATQPRAPAGQSDGGQWISDAGGQHTLPPTAWASLRSSETDGGDKPTATTDSTTLEDGTRVLSIRIHAGRKEFDEQHAVIAPDGESRIFETSGATQTIRDGDTGEVLSRTTFTPTDLVSEPVTRPAFSQTILSNTSQIYRTLSSALALFEVLSTRDDGYGTVLGMIAQEYKPGEGSISELPIWVGRLNQRELDATCPRNAEVQSILDDATARVKKLGGYPNATVLGSRIHAEVARAVNDQKDPDFVAEVIFSDMNEFGKRIISGSVRADVFERVHPDTACIYDPKTGQKGLTPARAIELSAAAQREFGYIKRFIIIQVRPTQ